MDGAKKEGSNSKKVMVPVDESESSYYALMWVLDNLKDLFTNSPLLIFAPQPAPKCNYTFAAHLGYAQMFCPLSSKMAVISNAQEQDKKVSLGILEKARNICISRGVKVDTITEAGEPRELICNAVEAYKIDLLAVGNNEDGALKRAIFGSLSNYCLNNAKCSVVVVRKP